MYGGLQFAFYLLTVYRKIIALVLLTVIILIGLLVYIDQWSVVVAPQKAVQELQKIQLALNEDYVQWKLSDAYTSCLDTENDDFQSSILQMQRTCLYDSYKFPDNVSLTAIQKKVLKTYNCYLAWYGDIPRVVCPDLSMEIYTENLTATRPLNLP